MDLMQDPDDGVRDMATFGLGQFGPDSLEISEALRRRCADSCQDVRDEALWGLAKRRDPEALRVLLRRIDADEWSYGDDDAATDALGLTGHVPLDEIRQGIERLLGN